MVNILGSVSNPNIQYNKDFSPSLKRFNLSLPDQLKKDTVQLSFKSTTSNVEVEKLFSEISNNLSNLNNSSALQTAGDNIDKLNSIISSKKLSIDGCTNLVQSSAFLKKLGKVFSDNHAKPEFETTAGKIDELFFNSYKNLSSDSSRKIIQNVYGEVIKNPDSTYGQIQAKKFFLTYNPDNYKEFDDIRTSIEKLALAKDTSSPEYINARKDLLKQEFTVLKQELINPQKNIERARQEGLISAKSEFKPEDEIKLKALRGLELHLDIAPHFDKIEGLDDEFIQSLTNTINNDAENIQIKTLALKITKRIVKNLSDKQKQEIQVASFKNAMNNSNNYVIRLYSADLFAKLAETNPKSKEQSIKSLLKIAESKNTDDKKIALITLAKLNYTNINEIIKTNIESPELKNTAIWATGKVKTPSNYEFLKQEITKNIPNIDKTDTQKIEYLSTALISLAEYGENDKENVVKFLQNINTNCLELKELAKDLTIKINPSLNKETLPEDYKSARTLFFKEYDELKPNAQRWIDKALFPFKSVLIEGAKKNGFKIDYLNDLLTSRLDMARGVRTDYGFFCDTASGVTLPDGQIIIPKSEMTTPDENMFVLGHEFGHALLYSFENTDKEIFDKVERKFKNCNSGNFLDLYGSQNSQEYFAEANEAYLSIYVPHDSLIFADDPEYVDGNTRFKLMKKDPEMYKLMQEIYTKYSKVA